MILSFGVLSSPVPVDAGLVSLFLGQEEEVRAEVLEPISLENSQNMVLLEANASPFTVVAKKTVKKDESKVAISTSIMSETALMPAVGPLGGDMPAIGGSSFDQVSVYVVRRGDTLSQVAAMFDVTIDTILSANDMQKGQALKEGDTLLILPFSGVEHTVARGDTLQGIAKKYGVDTDEILASNELESGSKLTIGDKLIIPGGTLSTSTVAKTIGVKKGGYSANAGLKTISGYFMNPVPAARKSRGTTASHRGVDLAAPIGTPIKASASGRVTFARSGYNGGFGNLVILAHENGTETLYAHQSKINTSVGARVGQGDIIGYVGNTGRSTGPHLHFEVHGAKNPGNDNTWAR